HRPRLQQGEAFFDLLEGVGAANQPVEIDALVHIEIGQYGEVEGGTDRAVVGAGEFFFAVDHGRRGDGGARRKGRDANQDGVASRRNGVDHQRRRLFTADGV